MRARWFLMALAHLAVVLLRYPLAPLAVLFRVSRYGQTDNGNGRGVEPRLPDWLSWLDTLDNSLWGDTGHRLRVGDPSRYWSMVRWLWRNGGNGLSYGAFGCQELPALRTGTYSWKTIDGHWLLRKPVRVGRRYIDLFFGWNLLGPKNGRCKLVCSIRLKSQ